jgi:hypothetical protein
MKLLMHYRYQKDAPSHTAGMLRVEGEDFYTIEPPWRNNETNISCIPLGRYRANFMPRSSSGKYRNVWHIQDVPGRTGVLIHSGNTVAHTLGCIILGTRSGVLGGAPAVLASRSAMGDLLRLLGPNDFELLII